jgi:hypothetical protein
LQANGSRDDNVAMLQDASQLTRELLGKLRAAVK